jgi:hypothetical protein
MNRHKLIFARFAGALVTLSLGAALQLAFWKSSNASTWGALSSHAYFWFFYLLAGLLFSEHFLRLLNRK